MFGPMNPRISIGFGVPGRGPQTPDPGSRGPAPELDPILDPLLGLFWGLDLGGPEQLLHRLPSPHCAFPHIAVQKGLREGP